MKTSIVMTTYNGFKYLNEQLESIRNQDINIDEVLVFDDGSTDGTQKFIWDYINSNRLNNWKLVQNEERLGWKKNFIESLKKATGDYIFPCDQDDIWHTDKIRKMTAIMETNHSINLLVSNYNVFIDDGNKRFKRNYNTDGTVESVQLSYYNIYNARPGCVFCFRKSFFDEYVSLWKEALGHDDFLWKTALITHSLYILNKCTIEYRRHAGNTTQPIHSISDRITDNHSCREFYEACLAYIKGLSNEDIDFLNEEVGFCLARENLFTKRNISSFFALLPKIKLYKRKKNFLGDFAYLIAPSIYMK